MFEVVPKIRINKSIENLSEGDVFSAANKNYMLFDSVVTENNEYWVMDLFSGEEKIMFRGTLIEHLPGAEVVLR